MNTPIFSQEEICALLPHRDPFLFVNRITRFRADRTITAQYDVPLDAFYLKGHFPGYPLVPGVILADALAQTAGLLWGFSKREREMGSTPSDPELFFLAADSMKYLEPVRPGCTVTLEAVSDGTFGGMYRYRVEASVNRKVVAKGELTLAIQQGTLERGDL